MKQKNKVEEFATKKELKAMDKSLRNEIKASANEVTEKLRGEIKLSADETVRKLEETIIGVKDILMRAMDSFAKDIEVNREDRELAVHQTSELRKDVDEHEKRIEQLEKTRHAV